ncbi:putative siderophore-binding lipoprotein YfiY precursor [Corynebacterium ciconiae DSM 44920]|uniref:iron-siderophore ABC transporter substrate-binding protein n=1 Tax=Corynebacterium ciconiae TaxID=227319 RepID=UPI0003770073|nr:iron-siderophore ABC transporter substrate-binding protein [Corynebacterium ciconiae]WKD61954.1 putative siderophore-binding lipoprotein YfiY precursor [Corynebacterium ciconiae DSM 44920]
MLNFSLAKRAVAVVVATAIGVTGCSSDGGDTSTAKDSDFETITIEHALGTAEIDTKPERVVTLGQGSAETAIALGVVPVAVEEYAWGADESGYLPWVKEAVDDMEGELPQLFQGGEELSAEEVLGFEPDLILAPWSGITQDQYDQLSAIAPTVAYPEEPWTITWEQQIATVATALGEKDRSDELIKEINDEFAAAEEPNYKDTTFSFIYNTGPEALGVFMPDEQRVAVVRKLGLAVDPVVEELEKDIVEGTDSAPLSPENLDKLDGSDLIFTFYRDEENRTQMHEDPAYSRIPAIERGSEVAPTDQSLVTASSMINPLSVPWMLDRYKKLIDEAISKV